MPRTIVDPPGIVQSAEKDEKWDLLVKAAIGFGKRSAQACVIAGAELLKAKMACPPGLWLKTIRKHGLTQRTAYYWLESFRRFSQCCNVATLNQMAQQLGELAAGEDKELPDREAGDEPEEHPLLTVILCKDCHRKGAVKDCKKCLAARQAFVGKGGKSGRTKKGGKGGKTAVDWREVQSHFGRLIRQAERAAKVYKADDTFDRLAKRLGDWLTEFRAAYESATGGTAPDHLRGRK